MQYQHYQWRDILWCLLIIITLNACEEQITSEGFERKGGEANVHFVYLNEEIYHGNKWQQQQDSQHLCEHYKQQTSCDVYIWTTLEAIPERLPLKQRQQNVGHFSMRNGQVAFFKEVNHEEPIEDVYGVAKEKYENSQWRKYYERTYPRRQEP